MSFGPILEIPCVLDTLGPCNWNIQDSLMKLHTKPELHANL